MTRRYTLLRALAEWAVFMAVYLATEIVIGGPWPYLVVAAYVGFGIGDCRGYKRGLKHGDEITRKVWGLDKPDIRRDLAVREMAKWN